MESEELIRIIPRTAKNFLIPPEGGLLLLPVGVSTIDFREGIITDANGNRYGIQETLSKNEYIRSLTITTDKDINIDFGARGKWGLIQHGSTVRITYQRFDVMKIKCTEPTQINIWATTHPTAAPLPALITEFFQGTPFVKEGTLTAGSPITIDIRDSLGHNAHSGTIYNAGTGLIYVYFSSDGSTFTSSYTIEAGQTIDLAKEDIWKIKLDTDTTGTVYRIIAH